jgi:hypothetical protein
MDELVYIFTGRVIPERATVNTSEFIFGIPESEDVPEGKLCVQIIYSQIFARYFGSGAVKNILTLRNTVEDSVRVILDVLGYFKGYAYDAEITQMIKPFSTENVVFGVDVAAIGGLVEKSGISIEDIFKVLFKPGGVYLREAFSDVREAMKSPRDTGFYCYRSIESLMNCCAKMNNISVKNNKSRAWREFRTTYSIEESDIKWIKEFADPPRHGDFLKETRMTDKNRADLFKKTWEIINKYILKEKEKVFG